MSTTLTCPNGHASTESDYCSVCGTLMAVPAPSPSPASAPVPVDDGPTFIPRPKPPAEECPNCSSELDPASKFCEVCGYDPTTGSLPRPPVVQAADDPSDPSASADPADPVTGTWVVVVAADRAYYDRNQVAEVQFPLGVPPRVIELPAAGDPVAIGRRSASRGTNPAIDLAGPPEDAAVSHTHASLLPEGDGWSLVDHGSTNGTYVNETTDPVPANTPVPLKSGDRIYLGAWTKLTLELHPDQPN